MPHFLPSTKNCLHVHKWLLYNKPKTLDKYFNIKFLNNAVAGNMQ